MSIDLFSAVFYLLAAITVLSAAGVAFSNNIVYSAFALMGTLLVVKAWHLARDPAPTRAVSFFGFSNIYLAVVFCAVAVDTLVHTA